ncbi:glycoside hydrolase family 3 protein [Spirochaeta isovalerica]|uniref:beta-N-acetylhexosaminidase n=1 Tax=Spirochaeta isovalerica TaxID=150 RepID=A0A841RAC2_9SPIO|nr:glycoside hydrolase family 3 protein [Spirochaeta isovalerica]MBB6479392.1 beta-N-acetylhexosaminidase [Spirochaeta isovalerica]
MNKKLIPLLILLTALFSCRTIDTGDSVTEKPLEPFTEKREEAAEPEQRDPVLAYMSTLSLEEKIGQMIIINARDISNSRSLLEVDSFLKDRLEFIRPGGVILFGGNLSTIPQTLELIGGLQEISRTPMFISADVEGGKINRLTASESLHATALPSNGDIGRMDSEDAVTMKARIIGREMSALGINMDFAPVADVLSNSENTVIGERSFGSDPQIVGEMVAQTVKILMEENVIPVIKHFPGHGDTVADTHLGSVSVQHDLSRLKSLELIPFKMGIDSGSPAVMTAHIQVPEVTGNDLPSTLSSRIISGLLRKELGFSGLTVTDSMGMGAITRRWEPGEAAVLAVEAGIDLILNPQSPEEAFEALVQACREGRLTPERIDESVYRIISVKMDFNIMDDSGQYVYMSDRTINPETLLGSEEHKYFLHN